MDCLTLDRVRLLAGTPAQPLRIDQDEPAACCQVRSMDMNPSNQSQLHGGTPVPPLRIGQDDPPTECQGRSMDCLTLDRVRLHGGTPAPPLRIAQDFPPAICQVRSTDCLTSDRTRWRDDRPSPPPRIAQDETAACCQVRSMPSPHILDWFLAGAKPPRQPRVPEPTSPPARGRCWSCSKLPSTAAIRIRFDWQPQEYRRHHKHRRSRLSQWPRITG